MGRYVFLSGGLNNVRKEEMKTIDPATISGVSMKSDSVPHVKRISRSIRDEEQQLRAQLPWLGAQDAIGLGIFAVSCAALVTLAGLYLGGLLPWWAAIPLIALPLSLLHELEHDLIHDLYFRERRWAQDVLFAVIFLAKQSMDPWTRRQIHLRHHRVSGQETDIEERLIGLGLPMGPLRLLITILPAATALLWPGIRRSLRAERRPAPPTPSVSQRLARLASAAFALLPLVVLPAALAGAPWAVTLAVLVVGPNLIRHATIAAISSSSHYCGDIPEGAVYYQNQILDHPLTWPVQLFCFNFGATHILHHYVVHQPFYIRQLVAPRVRHILLEEGVRRNDLGTFRRANRWSLAGR
ncbi:MAG: fatty acid desaturase [Myxococcota bacterium]|jgi:fatty acid desaturase